VAISTLAAYHELVPDATSPALGANTHMLQLDKISDDSDVRQLVKVHAAAFYNHVQVVQPFEVKGAPAVRGLWLWYANGPNRTALSLAEATHPKQSRYNRPQTLVYSYAEDCGRLVVSSCLNRAMDSGHVIVPSPTTASLHMSNVDFRDILRV
jgi:hypothetical protein